MTLEENFSGDIIKPGDSEYEQASTVLVLKGAPAIILRPRSTSDVVLAIQYATTNSLTVSVRSGGHSNAGFGTNNGGLVIDLRHLNEIELVDKEKHLVRIGSGASWIEVAKTLQQYGLAISSGDTKTVGVGGLTLGAGIGWMVRKYGLALDSLSSAEVVTASGDILRVSKTLHSDLFWAIRGGGGNFGIVTSFEFTAHPTTEVFSGSIVYDFDNLADTLKGWRDYMRIAPEELTTMFLIMPTLPSFGNMPPAAMILCCYAGDNEAQAMHALDPLLNLGKVVHKDITKKEYVDVLEDAHIPQGLKVIVNNTFIKDFSDDLIDTLSHQTGQILQIRGLGGAMNRVNVDETAFAHRDKEALIVSPAFVDLNASDGEIDAALAPWRKIEAFGDGGYINFFSEADQKAVTASYPSKTYARLAHIKKIYDPNNIFSQNINIKPSE